MDARDVFTRLVPKIVQAGNDPAAARELLAELRGIADVHAARLRLALKDQLAINSVTAAKRPAFSSAPRSRMGDPVFLGISEKIFLNDGNAADKRKQHHDSLVRQHWETSTSVIACLRDAVLCRMNIPEISLC